AKQIVNLAVRDFRNIIITINPLTYLIFPIKEFLVSTYFKLFSHKRAEKIDVTPTSEASEAELEAES
ncbi:MAG: hypothetical protein BRC41_08515, partial [Cyanobacteria bacterium QH_9_48_43]